MFTLLVSMKPDASFDVGVGLDLSAVRDRDQAVGTLRQARGFGIHELQAADLRHRLGPLPLRHDRDRAVGGHRRSACTAARPRGPLSPSTSSPRSVSSKPSELTFKLPPREYASLPSRACIASQPSPSIATSSTSPVCTSAPCERSKPKPVATVLTRLAIARALDRPRLEAREVGAKARRRDVGEVVRDERLRLHELLGTRHRNVQESVHARVPLAALRVSEC